MGPLTVARFGKNVVWQANWSEGDFARVQKHQVELLPTVVQEIDTLVSQIATLVSELPPEKLLHRAWWELAGRVTHIESEAEMEEEDAVSLRMIDYVQSLIAAVPPAQDQREEVTEEDWKTLRGKVEQLFQAVNFKYQICRTAKNKADDPNFNEDFEDFQFKAQFYWCNVRGTRYQVHQPAYLNDMFLPHSDALQELFGISGEQFVNEIKNIWHALSFGLGEAFESMDQFRKDALDAVDKKIAETSSEADLHVLMAEVVKEHGWEDRQNDIFGRFLGMDLFDVQKTTALPQMLLDQLTWSPGEEGEFFAEGPFRGWPLRIWPTFKRPFIRLNGRHYCFDLNSLLDNIYRGMQRIIFRLKPDYRETWNKIQQNLSEELPFKYLQRLLPGAKVLRQVYYRWRTESGATDWCEADGLLIYDDHLFVIESRGGAFTYTPPATDFPAYVSSLKNLVLKPAMQGKRFVEYLHSADAVPVFDKNHVQIGELSRADLRHVTICAVTLDPFTELAAQVQHLRKIGVDVGLHPVWAISVDDLRVYADIFENPLRFLHYVEQRMRAFQSDIVQSDDELDHLGLYLKHNHYSRYAEELQGQSGARITFHGYRSDVDKFFRERSFGAKTSCPLKQDTPTRILEIVDLLSQSNKPRRAEISAYLLDLSGAWREKISNGIDEELARQPTTKRPKPLSTHGGVNLTMYCWTESWARRDAAEALAHARTVLLVNDDRRRLLLELSYTDQGVLRDATWQWVDLSGIPVALLPRLRNNAEKLRQRRVAKAKTERRKIGRNEPCPCGSGKKYKKCCLGR